MALGFSFNKAKVLSAAEKFVQQGKIQNAIAEYDKVLKQDPKDLTVLNTIGDLYLRAGSNQQAVNCFRQVGDAYASAGFLVKAIAMYKKLTKMSPNDSDAVLRLADLYSQQGLYSDARSQYMVLADQYMKNSRNDEAAGIFKKMLELDPENAGMQTRLADLYIKLGKKDEAKEIYFHAAQALHMRGALDAAAEALNRVLKLDPRMAEALELQAQIALGSNNSEKAIACLEKLPDLESRPDALNLLLSTLLASGRIEEADPIISKLLTVHNDMSAVKPYAEALFHNGRAFDALRLYERHADRLLAADAPGLISSLEAAIGKVKDSAPALQTLLNLLQKAGDTTHINEVMELMAHANVQAGQLEKASGLYKELSELEPENPSHAQSLKQIAARMGTDSASRELSAEEGTQAFMVEELQHDAPALQTNYSKDVADAVRAALTDSELFSSYNLPEKAIAPLEAALSVAPQDPELHQQLAALYVRCGRFQDAANSCKILSRLYSEAGHQEQANQYVAMAAKYEDQAGEQPAMAPPLPRLTSPGVKVELKPQSTPEPKFRASSIAEYSFDEPAEGEAAAPAAMPPAPAREPAVLSAPPMPAPQIGGQVKEVEIPRDIAMQELHAEPAPSPVERATEPVAEEMDLSGEWEEMLVVEEAPSGSDGKNAQGAEFEVAASESEASRAGKGASEVEEGIEELRFYLEQNMLPEAQVVSERLARLAPGDATVAQLRSQLQSRQAKQAAADRKPEPAKPAAAAKELSFDLDLDEPAKPAKQQGRPGAPAPVLDIDFEQPAKPSPSKAPEKVAPKPKPAAAPAAAANPLGDLVLDLEEALGSDFGMPAAPAASAPAPAARNQRRAPAAAATATAAAVQKPVREEEATSVLSDLFEEFKGEVGEASDDSEDSETHYNLGVAFKEMGLLDEAIGELQKVCHSMNNGRQFSQAMQAYTWLAHCLMEKGAPQAAVRWYESALKLPGIAEESRLAVYYDLASAHEAAGDRKAALDDLMKVYGSNIDYRDVAEKIKVLRS